MSNPIQLALTLHHAWIDAWLASTSLALRGWGDLIDLDGRLFQEADALIRRHAEIDDGPTFTGKYGRRRFDIDPEHDV
ncbi:hypothetical protein [Phaeospirillum tilakii]|uniref:Uncharacterized protein n=1 Tax=Phaeospirillum tilakii TaxID=741673 RepID=A0ABW5CF92_9PROT